MRLKDKTCYMCDRPATTREHIPPDSLFAHHKGDLRGNLITVPSCEEHNGEKSEMDECLRNILTTTIQTNKAGLDLFSDKGLRSTDKNTVIDRMLEGAKVVPLENQQTTMAYSFDKKAVTQVFEMMARGIYFDHFGGQKWQHSIHVFLHFDFPSSESSATGKAKIHEMFNSSFSNVEGHGACPEVFYYKFIDGPPGHYEKILRLCFFEGVEVTVWFEKKGC